MIKDEVIKKIRQFGDCLLTFTDGSYHVVTLDIENARVPVRLSKKGLKGSKIEAFSWTKFDKIIIDPEKVSHITRCPVSNIR